MLTSSPVDSRSWNKEAQMFLRAPCSTLRHTRFMKAYVINLSDRTDRWDSVLAQTDSLGFEIVRVEAVKMSDIDPKIERYAAPGVAATWASHKLAMELFLNTDEEFALILEDDFLLTNRWQEFSLKLDGFLKALHIDFLQLGYLVTSPLDRGFFLLSQVWDLTLKIMNRARRIPLISKLDFFNKFLILEQSRVPWALVPNLIRPGGQSYVVSRNFAEAAKFMNSPTFNTTDGYFLSLGDMRTFRMFRTRESVIHQSSSETSVKQRFI
jgi:GR25 family glycosyltransferase involved in LPS biosynthesis